MNKKTVVSFYFELAGMAGSDTTFWSSLPGLGRFPHWVAPSVLCGFRCWIYATGSSKIHLVLGVTLSSKQ